jgi:hypothetical protein
MKADPASIRTSGPAFRVIVLVGEQPIAYHDVQVKLDPGAGLFHVLDRSGNRHFLSVPISLAVVEWSDAASLEPVPYVPGFGPGAFEAVGRRLSEMSESMSRAFRKE